MKKTVGALLSLVLAGILVAAPMATVAQNGDPDNMTVESIELDQADIRDALKVLFRSTGLNYTVAPDVQGVVTVSLKQVPFKTALRNILGQVNATWREEGNIFNIIRKPEVTNTTTTGTTGDFGNQESNEITQMIPLKSDPLLILNLLLGSSNPGDDPETTSGIGIQGSGGGLGGFSGGGGGLSGGGGFSGGGGGFSGGGGFGGGGFGGGGSFGGGGGGFGGGGGGR